LTVLSQFIGTLIGGAAFLAHLLDIVISFAFVTVLFAMIFKILLGQTVRYDGRHKRDYYLTDIFARFVEWVPVCPELEVGMGVPREPVRLVAHAREPSLIAERSGKDWSAAMRRFSAGRAGELKRLNLSGYILKKASPSCGMQRVKVYSQKGGAPREGRGLFAAALINTLPLMPVEEEGRLKDAILRENFIERVFAYRRWLQAASSPKSIRTLIDFHTAHKFQLLAHSERHYRRLGCLVANAKQIPLDRVYERYGRRFMEALTAAANHKQHANVLQHLMGYFSTLLSPMERQELVEVIGDFRRQWIPLIVPITLIRHYVKKYAVEYLDNQDYLAPGPRELMLRNHV
jgi:uncharacterized protein YbgA (DUF1722 family)/uncharacterized protein YbbK (DUF523 family)